MDDINQVSTVIRNFRSGREPTHTDSIRITDFITVGAYRRAGVYPTSQKMRLLVSDSRFQKWWTENTHDITTSEISVISDISVGDFRGYYGNFRGSNIIEIPITEFNGRKYISCFEV